MAELPEPDSYGQSFSSVPRRLVSEDRYGLTPDGPLLPRGVKRPRRSSPRLQGFDYTGPYAYSLTMNADGGRPAFGEARFVAFCIDKLNDGARISDFKLLAYCFMPNHIHLLIKGLNEDSRLKPFVQNFKQALGFAFKIENQRPLWHRSFYDHVIRVDEDLHAAAAYIWANPVRAGLVERMEDYPYSGPSDRMPTGTARGELARDDEAHRDVGGQSLSSVPTGGEATSDLDAR